MLVVNIADPSNIAVTNVSVPALVNHIAVAGNLLYTASSAGLLIYQVEAPSPSIPYTASVEVPNSTGVEIVAGSFNIAPTQIIDGTDFDTLVWSGETAPTLTWQSTVSNLQAGEALDVTLGATVAFTSQGTAATLNLAPTVVTGAQMLALSPASQSVAPAASATYTVTVTNPTSASDTFNLSVLGVPSGWVNFPPSVTIAANSSSPVTLTLTSAAYAALADYGFTVTADDANGAMASVHGDLILAGTPTIETEAYGVVAMLTPTQATAGQGTSTRYVVQLTNTGSADDTFSLAAVGLPSGVTATFAETTIDVPPGASNFRDVSLELATQKGTTSGSYPFTVTAISTAGPSVIGTADGTLTVDAAGVKVSLSPGSARPAATSTRP